MASSGSGQTDIFDVRKIRRLVELMKEHDLNEIDLRQTDQRIRIRRGQDPVITTAGQTQPVAVPQAAPATPAPPAVPAPEGAAAAADDHLTLIKSPMVGTYYTSPNPDSAPFVKVGDAVGPETTVCIVEAMKVFNEIAAECSGKIVAMLVENGDPVEFGQPLFKIDPKQ